MKSLWPAKWTVKDLQKMQKEDPITFAKEYQNDPRERLNASFKSEDFRYWKQEGSRYILLDEENKTIKEGNLYDCRGAIANDLAWSDKRGADRNAMVPGFLTPDSDILIAPYRHETGLRPDEVADWLFAQEAHMREVTDKSVLIGFEKAMLEKVVQWFLSREMKRRNHFLSTRVLQWDGDKTRRIEVRLQARYRAHSIYHREGMGDLEDQLVQFPDAAHDDLPDAVQGLVQLLTSVSAPLVKKVRETSVLDDWIKNALPKKPVCKYPGTHKVTIPSHWGPR